MDIFADLRKAIEEAKEIRFSYTNYLGETSERRVMPLNLYEGVREYHPDFQWLLLAQDSDKNEIRNFAVKYIHGAIRT